MLGKLGCVSLVSEYSAIRVWPIDMLACSLEQLDAVLAARRDCQRKSKRRSMPTDHDRLVKTCKRDVQLKAAKAKGGEKLGLRFVGGSGSRSTHKHVSARVQATGPPADGLG